MVKRLAMLGILGVLVPAASRAQDQAIVGVGGYAEPPATRIATAPVATDEGDAVEPRHAVAAPVASPFRLSLEPAAATTGRGIAPGLGVAADCGGGTVGFRMAVAWLRGEPAASADAAPSPIGQGLSQYTGELTVDLHDRGPVHPVLGVGFGIAYVNRDGAPGKLGIGTARLGLEVALAVADADVRLGAGVTGVMPGPTDATVSDVHGWVLAGAGMAVGF